MAGVATVASVGVVGAGVGVRPVLVVMVAVRLQRHAVHYTP